MVDKREFKDASLDEVTRKVLDSFVADVTGKFGEEVHSLILYGSRARSDFVAGKSDINLLVVVNNLDMECMNLFIPLHDKYVQDRIVPLILTRKDLANFVHLFPLKFQSFKEAYIVLYGQDALEDLQVDDSHVKFRCKQELQNLLMRLRYHFIDNQGRGLTNIMARTSTNFVETLRIVTLLETGSKPDRAHLVETAEAIGIDKAALTRVLEVRRRDVSLPNSESRVIFESYLKIIEQLLAKLDEN